MHPMLTIAVKAARRAGSIINQASQNLDLLNVSKKSHSDYVSEVDGAAEDAIIKVLLAAYPDHAILAEESGRRGDEKNSEYQWIIDPLDGTTNFLHGFPKYSVSIAVKHKGVLSHAVVYDPTNNELFTASRGGGAFLNDRRIRVSKRTRLEDCLIGTGIPFRDLTHLDAYIAMFKDIIPRTAGIRRPGSAALDLAYVANGRYDGFWEIGLAPWDMAAGCLLITEAGGLVGDLEGNETQLESGQIIAGNPKIFGQLLQVIAPHLTPALIEMQRTEKSQ
ncbi:MAG: inositol monophosphatase family protein [Nitrosomonas sp.]|jgi:myo-inositol-1(or 4)-monophosphatase|uniref:inositol monophosphatase family protein n=1 Tax=Nitrosomonas sp. TaxID=42353 RepID=UPI00271A42FC|nr:inositol monophosphatase family protein [Nitrosomonas sp.]MDO8894558.1 inositol monophosphatase family protein [Nitrosomonas sp.]MDP1786177.1 inositol monophosphatase family protein [Nitrosomonas sp.]MDP1934694.1 inositol monophosphatase family protein [Nitrosomonas sp.]MDP2224614.1 inositol monophosphatase family protein [Nitrosomonas sp.]MDP3282709.1 inositol monophosphatase family protein [Nitrosomonas sp.]